MACEVGRRDFLRWLATSGAGLAAAGLAPAVFAQEAAAAGSDVVVLTPVTLIDGTGAPARSDVAIVLVGDRVAWIGPPADLPPAEGARVLDGRGKYVVPGLCDMHTHGADMVAFPALHLVNGVTTIREMWGYPENRVVRDRIERGELLGPRIVLASGIIDGPVSLLEPPVVQVSTEDEARAAVRTAKAEGAEFVKVYSYLGRDAFGAVAGECGRLGLPFGGHWPYRVTIPEASAAGQRSFEHLYGMGIHTSTRRDEFLAQLAGRPFDPAAPRAFYNLVAELDRQGTLSHSPARARALFELLVHNGSWLSPTLIVNRVISAPAETYAHDPRLRYVQPSLRDYWKERIKVFAPVTPREIAEREAYFQALLGLLGDAYRAGVGVIGGTDCLNPYSFPGFGLHDDLEFLVQAGLSPMQALQTVTRDAARYLGRQDTAGTVTVGKAADLVVLDANPLAGIGAVRRIDTVISRGRVFDRATRAKVLADVETAVQTDAPAARAGAPTHDCC
ncbi:amidohydrolase family protein [Amycolatopsis sp. NPDC059021]|uniref:amidohydrolase family protein n=1 Tax=Amycolatopsis sp. NPDC059021 TaxID=3346704 RepID=UPI0036726DFA